MSDMPATIIETPNPYEELLALPTIAQQLARLQHANLAHVSGLLALLDDAAALMRTNPTPTPTPTPLGPEPTTTPPITSEPATTPSRTTRDPDYGTCKNARAHRAGPYLRDRDPEYHYYQDRSCMIK